MSVGTRPPSVAAAVARARQSLGAGEAGHVVAAALRVGRGRLFAEPERRLTRQERDRLARLVAGRRRGLPHAYLTGRAGFWDMDLAVGPGVLVPRPETECLVEAAIAFLAARPAGGGSALVADLGTGSGAVGLAVARARPDCRVVLADRSVRALAYARRNAARFAPAVRVLPPGDLVRPLRRAGLRPDLVLMNPPYLTRREWDRVAREVRHEPRAALDGGADGLGYYRRLAADVPPLLAAGGALGVEVGAGQATAVAAIFGRAGLRVVRVLPDLAGIARVVWAEAVATC